MSAAVAAAAAAATAPAPLTEAQRAFAEAIGAGVARASKPADPTPTATLGNLKAGAMFEVGPNGDIRLKPATPAADAPAAEMGALLSAVEKPLSGLKLPGNLNLGPMILGGVAGAVVSEVINGVMPRGGKRSTSWGPVSANTGLKIGAIVLLAVAGSKVMSKSAATAAATVIAAQVLADVLPLDSAVDKIVDLIRPDKTGKGEADAENRMAHAGAFVAPRTQRTDPLSAMWGR